jgi:hypothetical protein
MESNQGFHKVLLAMGVESTYTLLAIASCSGDHNNKATSLSAANSFQHLLEGLL